MKLEPRRRDETSKAEEYYPACGTHKGTLYRIVQERGRFLLEAVSIGIGIGMQVLPSGIFSGTGGKACIHGLPRADRETRRDSPSPLSIG